MEDYKKIITDYLLNQIPKILNLLDRNIYSSTFGCFDREFWHYKSRGFLNGMNQCYIYTLTLFYLTEFKDNYLFMNKNLKSLIIGAINYSLNNLHKDGSFDEHYFNEHSEIATALPLYCITESIIRLDLNIKSQIKKLRKAADFLIKNNEKYLRSNHLACKILALYNIYLITNEKKYLDTSDMYLNELLSEYKNEGWFPEYQGCDPGYLTLTLTFLTKLAIKKQDTNLFIILEKIIDFCSNFFQPDGTYGGFYGSRITSHFLPYGFEFTETKKEIGKELVNLYLISLKNGNIEYLSDNKFDFLIINDLLDVLKKFSTNRTTNLPSFKDGIKFFKEAGLYIIKKKEFVLIISFKKAGVIYFYKNGELIFRNCGIVGRTNKGFITSTGFKNSKYKTLKNGFCIEGDFVLFNNTRTITKHKYLAFSILNHTLGFLAKYRKFLKKFLIDHFILHDKPIDISFSLQILLNDKITLNIKIKKNKKIFFKDLRISAYFSSIYVPSADLYQKSDLFIEDIGLKSKLNELNNSNQLEYQFDL